MSHDIAKQAIALGVLALVTAAGLHNHWFEQGGVALSVLMTPRNDAPIPARAAVNYPVSYAPAAPAPRAAWGTVELSPDALAQYHTDVEINGARLNALVDTGASHVFLSAADARALNIDVPASAYTALSQTANGVARNAPVRLRQVRVGDIIVYDVDALVAQPGKESVTLLGMSFLKKLSSFQNAGGRLVLKQ